VANIKENSLSGAIQILEHNSEYTHKISDNYQPVSVNLSVRNKQSSKWKFEFTAPNQI
jgi:hypothetical protein